MSTATPPWCGCSNTHQLNLDRSRTVPPPMALDTLATAPAVAVVLAVVPAVVLEVAAAAVVVP